MEGGREGGVMVISGGGGGGRRRGRGREGLVVREQREEGDVGTGVACKGVRCEV